MKKSAVEQTSYKFCHVILLISKMQWLPQAESVQFVVTNIVLLQQTADYWPTHGWRSATPESQGIDSEDLVEALDYLLAAQINIHCLLIVRNGQMILDANFYPGDSVHNVASVTKSITSILTGIAVDKGFITTDNRQCR
ncbi:hypothetical protein PN36_16700 [Candidatus Thiomargarita nelsonii]|uniref:Uncharacterized protein n=1 Tax=Candidatus Thiomargarita nelsonii TaxID=1003181 RepID=A0A0A6PJT1_9GAMM|nr:hypothetical protein PN36_16700 [Candidatus Thiomargarita nelsonii]